MAHYDSNFYKAQQDGSFISARAVLPHVLGFVCPSTVIDVGCGIGTWLAAAHELGVNDYLGIDGDYVDRSMLRIPQDRFRAADLSRPFDVGRFDLAISMEVAEHLPPGSAKDFVASLVRAAPVVFMSAAIPGQGGVNHLNEQWQDYWADLFRSHDYVAFDTVRNAVWDHPDVQSYYAQNAILYTSKGWILQHPKPSKLQSRSQASLPLRVVHPKLFSALYECTRPDSVSLRSATRQWVLSARRAVARRLRRDGQ